MFMSINELENDNYIDNDVINASRLSGDNYVLAYIANDSVDTCIVKRVSENFVCVANSSGFAYDCCLNEPNGLVYSQEGSLGKDMSIDESYLFD